MCRKLYSCSLGPNDEAFHTALGEISESENRAERGFLSVFCGSSKDQHKGRKGKTVTTVSAFQLADDELKNLATQLKRHCGTGGSVKDGVIIIQGDHRDTLITELKNRGFKAKIAGI